MRNGDGGTPLFVASQMGHAATVTALLAAPGIAVNAAMKAGTTPLIIASRKGHFAIVSALLAVPGVSVNAAEEAGWTPLHFASSFGHAAVVSALLAHPTVDVNPRTKRLIRHYSAGAQYPAGSTPLWLARHRCHLGVAALLEARGGVV